MPQPLGRLVDVGRRNDGSHRDRTHEYTHARRHARVFADFADALAGLIAEMPARQRKRRSA